MVYSIQYEILDEAGLTSNTQVNIPDTVTVANAQIFAQEMAKYINAISDGAIVGISMAVRVPIPAAVRTTPVDGSRVEVGAYFGFRTDENNPTSLRIPARREAIVVDGSKAIDIEETQVAAFIAAMTDGIDLTAATPVAGTGTVQPVDKRDEDIVSLRVAKEQTVATPKSA